MKKLSVIGAGSAGLLSAVQGYYAFINMPDWEVELIHDPNAPPEKVGQGTVPGIMNLLSTVFDVDSAAALKSRKEILDMVSTDKLLCTSGHMIQPKFGYIEKSGESYRMAS